MRWTHSQHVTWNISIKSNHFCQTFENSCPSPLCMLFTFCSSLMWTWYSKLRSLRYDPPLLQTHMHIPPIIHSHRLASRFFSCYMLYLKCPPILSPPYVFCQFLWPCLSCSTPFRKNLIKTQTWLFQKLGELVPWNKGQWKKQFLEEIMQMKVLHILATTPSNL